MMAAVFSMQGIGQLAAAIVALITTVAFKDQYIIGTTGSWSSCHDACQLAGDRAWRIIIGFAAVPACFALYYRITIPETPRYTFDIAHDIEKAQADIVAYMNNEKEGEVDPISQQKTKQRLGKHLALPAASWSDCMAYFSQWDNFKVLFGTTSSWFFLDLAFVRSPFSVLSKTLLTREQYGLGLNNSIVLSAIGFSAGKTIYANLLNTAIGNLILACAGSIPGYWLSVALIDTLGRKPIQILGFFFLTIIFIIIGFAYHTLSESSLLALYILAQLFFNFGPNTTTFIVPGECFPTRYRSTGHGLSAAAGKVGAIIAQVIAQPLLSKGAPHHCHGSACSPWLNHLMQIFALFMLCGTLVSFLVPETKGRTLEELAGEGSTPIDSIRGSVTRKKGFGGWWARWNPFRGGKPAGFRGGKNSPLLGPKSPGLRGKRERVGIMTSPELIPKMGNREGDKRSRTASAESALTIRGDTAVTDGSDDLYLRGVGAGGSLPGWGAGWGVQRHPRPGDGSEREERGDSFMLQDVGRLLK